MKAIKITIEKQLHFISPLTNKAVNNNIRMYDYISERLDDINSNRQSISIKEYIKNTNKG